MYCRGVETFTLTKSGLSCVLCICHISRLLNLCKKSLARAAEIVRMTINVQGQCIHAILKCSHPPENGLIQLLFSSQMHVTQVGVAPVMDWLVQHFLSPFWPSFLSPLKYGSMSTTTKVGHISHKPHWQRSNLLKFLLSLYRYGENMEEKVAKCSAGDCYYPICNWSRTLDCFSIGSLQ